MLTRNHRQEALSRAYIHAIAAHAGVSYSLVGYDYGIDISLRAINVVGNRRTDGGVQLDLQLKSATRASVSDTQVSYDLDVDNYDDLRALEPPCPRVLVVLVLPADESLWLEQSAEELTIRHCAYWISLKGRPAVAAVRTIRVGIPVANVFSVAGLQAVMQRVRERKEP